MTLIAVILALAGAPAATPVTCAPAAIRLPGGPAAAYTVMSAAPTITLAKQTCQGLRSRTTAVRAVSDYVLLREAVHATGIADECADDVQALAELPRLLQTTLRPDAYKAGLAAVQSYQTDAKRIMGCPS